MPKVPFPAAHQTLIPFVSRTRIHPSIPDKIREARRVIDQGGYKTVIESDGGIRRNTVPLIKEAGSDYIVAGSLMFREDPREMREWLASL